MSDQIVINVIEDSPTLIKVGESFGLVNHSVTHQDGGSDELLHNLLGGLQGGTGSQYYHLTQSQYNNLVTGSVVRPSETGQFYPANNPSGFITGVNLSHYATTGFVTGVSGFLQNQISVINSQTGTYITGEVIRPFQTGQFYSTSNPSGFISSADLSIYVTGDVVRPSETGEFITQSQTGQFYATSNPSGFITGVDLSNYATIPYTTGISGSLQTQINSTNQKLSTAVFVTGNQDISGLKDFQTRPTVLDIPVSVSGDAVDTIHLYGQNAQGATIYKGQPVYINSANGNNPLIQLASNTGERTSSKTIGLLAQDLAINEFGYVITEGLLEGFNTSAGNASDPMWLGPTGNIIYGLTNKPYGNNHLVYLGIVLRSNNNNGKVYVKVQNGFEIDELHSVYAKNPSNKDALLYNSGSGAWLARQLNTGDVSGINNYVLNSSTGQFYPSNNPSGFITDVNLTSYATNNFVTGVSGNLQTQISSLNSQTGSYVTGQIVRPSETGQFYSSSNPSGFITNSGSSTLTNKIINGSDNTITNIPILTAVSGLGSGVATFLASPTSDNLRAAITNETGTEELVFANEPTITSPTIAGTAQFTGTSRPTSAATGTPSATSLITRSDNELEVFYNSPRIRRMTVPNAMASSGTAPTVSISSGIVANVGSFALSSSGGARLIEYPAAINTVPAFNQPTRTVIHGRCLPIITGSGVTRFVHRNNAGAPALAGVTDVITQAGWGVEFYVAGGGYRARLFLRVSTGAPTIYSGSGTGAGTVGFTAVTDSLLGVMIVNDGVGNFYLHLLSGQNAGAAQGRIPDAPTLSWLGAISGSNLNLTYNPTLLAEIANAASGTAGVGGCVLSAITTF